MIGYHTSTILCTVIADPTPICSVTAKENPIGCEIRCGITQSAFVNGKWEKYNRYFTLTAWYATAKKLIDAKWCRKGKDIFVTARTTEKAYEHKGQPAKKLIYDILECQPVFTSSPTQQNTTTAPTKHTAPAPTAPAPDPYSDAALSDTDYPF